MCLHNNDNFIQPINETKESLAFIEMFRIKGTTHYFLRNATKLKKKIQTGQVFYKTEEANKYPIMFAIYLEILLRKSILSILNILK